MRSIILAIVIFSLSNSCTKIEDCPIIFHIPSNLSPQKTDYQIGDTITIRSKFHRDVLALNIEGDEVGRFDMEGISWKPATGIFRTDTSNFYNSTLHQDFIFLPDTNYNYNLFVLSDGFGALDGEYNYRNDSFYLEIKLITKKIGTYLMRHESAVNGDQNFPGKCKHNSFDVWSILNGGVDNNMELLRESPDPKYNTSAFEKPDVRFQRVGGYCFRVIE